MHTDFRSGQMTTGLIGRDADQLATMPVIDGELLQIAGDGLTLTHTGGPSNSLHFQQVTGLRGLRLNAPAQRQIAVLLDGQATTITLNSDADRLLDLGWQRPTQIDVDGKTIAFNHGRYFVIEQDLPRGSVGAHAGDGAILSPMPGKVTSVEVAAGDAVTKGQRLLTLEAMKMEHGLTAPFDGVVAELNAAAGAQVQVDALLVVIEPNSSPAKAGAQDGA